MLKKQGRGGGLVVSVLAIYSDDPSSNPADYFNYCLCKKTKIYKKPGLAQLKKDKKAQDSQTLKFSRLKAWSTSFLGTISRLGHFKPEPVWSCGHLICSRN